MMSAQAHLYMELQVLLDHKDLLALQEQVEHQVWTEHQEQVVKVEHQVPLALLALLAQVVQAELLV